MWGVCVGSHERASRQHTRDRAERQLPLATLKLRTNATSSFQREASQHVERGWWRRRRWHVYWAR
jgi:hypothetical protein